MFKTQTMMIEITVALLALLSLFCSSCTIKMSANEYSKGKKVTRTFDVKDFDAISMSTGDVIFIQDSTYSVTVETCESMVDDIDVKVENGELSFLKRKKKNNRKWVYSKKGVEYKAIVRGPQLHSVSISGSGEFECKGLSTEDIRLSIAGSGEVDLDKLTARTVWANISGSGDISLERVKAESAQFSIAGSGDIDAEFTYCDDVAVKVAGSGDVELKGTVKHLEKNIDGSGNIDTTELRIQSK